MDKHNSQQRPRPQKQKILQGAKQRRVRKLEDGASNGGHEGRFRLRNAVLVKVMKVSKAKDDGRQEDDSAEAGAGLEQQRDGGSSEETLFGDGALNKPVSMYENKWDGWN